MNRRSLLTLLAGSGTGLLLTLIILLLIHSYDSAYAQTPTGANSLTVSSGIGTTFTYQGRLTTGSVPANGAFDFTFAVYDAPTNGTQVGLMVTKTSVIVQNGFFTADLDFGNVFTGTARYLELAVRPVGAGTFTPLAPRQAITPTPYALWAANVINGQETWELGGIDTDYKTGAIAYGTRIYWSNPPGSFVSRYINNFSPPSAPKLIDSVHFFIAERGGSYTDTVTLAIDVRDFNGTLKRTLSTSVIDLKTAPSRQFVSVALTPDRTQRVIEPDEYLGVRIDLGGGQAGDFYTSMCFRAQVRDP